MTTDEKLDALLTQGGDLADRQVADALSGCAPLALKMQRRFTELSEHELFVSISGDDLWSFYLLYFPESAERTERDCSCCEQFIRRIGNVVAIVNGRYETVWDLDDLEYPFDIVADRLDRIVRDATITGSFRGAP